MSKTKSAAGAGFANIVESLPVTKQREAKQAWGRHEQNEERRRRGFCEYR